jgi:hypothetical protein
MSKSTAPTKPAAPVAEAVHRHYHHRQSAQERQTRHPAQRRARRRDARNARGRVPAIAPAARRSVGHAAQTQIAACHQTERFVERTGSQVKAQRADDEEETAESTAHGGNRTKWTKKRMQTPHRTKPQRKRRTLLQNLKPPSWAAKAMCSRTNWSARKLPPHPRKNYHYQRRSHSSVVRTVADASVNHPTRQTNGRTFYQIRQSHHPHA